MTKEKNFSERTAHVFFFQQKVPAGAASPLLFACARTSCRSETCHPARTRWMRAQPNITMVSPTPSFFKQSYV